MRPIAEDGFEVGHYTLRPWLPADLTWLFHTGQDAEIGLTAVGSAARLPSPCTAAGVLAFYRRASLDRRAGTALSLALTVTDTGELLGSAALSSIDWGLRCAAVAWWLGPYGRGRGVMADVLPGLVEWSFEELALGGLRAMVPEGAERSERLLRATGFTRVAATLDCGAPAALWELTRPAR